MGFPDNRIDQSGYKSGKKNGLTEKWYCENCKQRVRGVMYMNANGKRVCQLCAGRAGDWGQHGASS